MHLSNVTTFINKCVLKKLNIHANVLSLLLNFINLFWSLFYALLSNESTFESFYIFYRTFCGVK